MFVHVHSHLEIVFAVHYSTMPDTDLSDSDVEYVPSDGVSDDSDSSGESDCEYDSDEDFVDYVEAVVDCGWSFMCEWLGAWAGRVTLVWAEGCGGAALWPCWCYQYT